MGLMLQRMLVYFTKVQWLNICSDLLKGNASQQSELSSIYTTYFFTGIADQLMRLIDQLIRAFLQVQCAPYWLGRCQ